MTHRLKRLLMALGIQTSGYRPRILSTDLLLGAFISLDYILWGYTFAALMFTGALAVYLPLAVSVVLVSTAIIALTVALTSQFPVNIAGNEPQAVAILATISMLMNAQWDTFTSVDSAAATLFAIMSLSALLLGVCFYLVSRFRLSPLIQMMPFPVVCGFLAGTGWLFVTAGITMITDIEVELLHLSALFASPALGQLALALLCGVGVYVAMVTRDHFLTLPLSLLTAATAFYGVALWNGLSAEDLRAGGWLFRMDASTTARGLGDLDFSGVSIPFIVGALPEIGTIVLISLLTATFSFSAMELGTGIPLDPDVELRGHGAANLLSGTFLGLPGSVEIGSSVMFYNMGASSRLLGLMCGLSCLGAAFLGGGIVEWVPKIVMAAVVFVVGFQFIHEWLFKVSKNMLREDAVTVVVIFGVIVVLGFIAGVVVGIALSSLLFIIRLGKVDVVDSVVGFNQISSSVERSFDEHRVLREHGRSAQIFNLRGFLFFGSANGFFERIKTLCDAPEHPTHLIFNFRRVIGVDSTAAQVFLKINQLLQSRQISVYFCDMNGEVRPTFDSAKVFDADPGQIVPDLDRAMKQVEEQLLSEHATAAGHGDILSILSAMLGAPDKAQQLLERMERLELDAGDYLFHQGESDTTAYVIASGAVEVRLEGVGGQVTRLREFRQGALVGEMAAYSNTLSRSASAVATQASVVYRLMTRNPDGAGASADPTDALLHEMVARQLVSRLGFMNQRTAADV